jgi:hypothetical protein
VNVRVLIAQLYKAQLNAAIYTSRSNGSDASAACIGGESEEEVEIEDECVFILCGLPITRTPAYLPTPIPKIIENLSTLN